MEGKLFFISIWCGLYGQLLRLVFKNESVSRKNWVTMVMNALFWATGSAMLGMLISSYFEKLDDMIVYSFFFALAGLVIGAVVGLRKAGNPEVRDSLLKDNLEWADTGFSAILLASFVMFFIVQAFKIPSGSMRMTFVEGDHLFVNKYVYGVPVPFTNKKISPSFNVQIPLPFTDHKITIFKKVERGDIVIFRFPTDDKSSPHYGKDFIKRVVATEGQQVQVINKDVFVDGVKLVEPYRQNVDTIIFPGLDDESKKRFQVLWENREYQGNEIRDNFGPVVIPPGDIMVMGDNRDRSYDSRFWGPLPISEIKGKAWLLYWPFTRFRLAR